MSKPLSIAERGLGLVFGAAQTGLRAAGGLVTAVRGSRPEAGAGAAAPPKSQLTDAALARKVESEIFREGSVPKGKIDVNAVGRVVYLRGQAKSAAMVADLTVRAQAIPEVERVENLLETPRTRGSKATGSQKPLLNGASARRRRPARRVNAEAPPTVAAAEPSPKDLAAKGEGRAPAPLGSNEPEKKEPKAAAGKTSAARSKTTGSKSSATTRGRRAPSKANAKAKAKTKAAASPKPGGGASS